MAVLSNADQKARRDAIARARKQKARAAAPALAKALQDTSLRDEAVVALGELGNADSVQPLLDAIDTKIGAGSDEATRAASRTNAKIAEALGALGDGKAGSALLRLARTKDDLVRLRAVEALGALKFKDAVPELSHIVDDDSTPPLIIKKAVVALGQIADPAAIPALQHALVIERQGVSFISEASWALFQLGPAAVEPMLKLATDRDPDYLAWAKERSRAPAGTYAKAALVLGDLGDARAVPVLLGKLKYTDPDPIPATARLLTNLVREFSADALGRLRAKEAARPILELVKAQDAGDLELVTFASNALVWIGDRSLAPDLVKRAAAPGVVQSRLAIGEGAALLGDPSIRPALAAAANAKAPRQDPSRCVEQLAGLGQTADDKEACASLQQAQARTFSQLLVPLDAAKECAQDAKCWSRKLAEPTALVRARAAYELGRAGATEAVPALAKAAADDDLTARLAAIRALEWLVPLPAARELLKGAAPELLEQLQKEHGKLKYVKVNEDLKRLQARMARL